MKLNKVAVLGVGMIGGSIALSLKKNGISNIFGYGRKKTNLEYAVKNKIIDAYSFEIDKVVNNADLVFICTPVCTIPEIYKRIKPFLKNGCIVSDIGSTKSWIIKEIEKTKNENVFFVGSHPMAGSEKSSVKMAKENLFENAICVLAKTKYTENFAIKILTDLWNSFKAKVIIMTPEEHDEIVAITSHLPHLIATSIIDFVKQKYVYEKKVLSMLAGGFRDTTRIASGDYEICIDIIKTNRLKISQSLKMYIENLKHLRKLIHNENYKEIKDIIIKAKAFRDSIPLKGKGVIESAHEICVDIQDRPGKLGEITSILGENNVNISDVQVITVRKNEAGVLILSFESNDDLEKSIEILKKMGYSVKRKF